MCRSRIIEQLRDKKDPLIKKFTRSDLHSITKDNRFHFSEESETDSNNLKERKIVIKDMI